MLDEYRNVDSESVQAVSDAVAKAGRDLGFVTLDATSFGSAKAISIDYAVMLGRIFTVGGYTLLSRLTGFARDIMIK